MADRASPTSSPCHVFARNGLLGGGTSETLRDLIGKRLIANVNDSDGIFGLPDT